MNPDDEKTFIIKLDDITASTYDWSSDTMSSGIMAQDVYTIDANIISTNYTGDTITISNLSSEYNISWPELNNIDPDEVERMCKEYPSLEKVWRNFKSIYDMCKQDYNGKKQAGELDDDLPF